MTRPRPPLPPVVHAITRAHVDRYAELSGDRNPLHVDAEYARAAGFPGVIAHGPIGLQTVFEALARWLGGDAVPSGVRVDVRFRAPVAIGDVLTCRAEAIEEHAGDVLVCLSCRTAADREVLQALAIVPAALAPKP